MSRRFRPGDQARVIAKQSQQYGAIVTIVSPLRVTRLIGYDGIARITVAYRVDTQPIDGISVSYEPHELAPIHDGDEPASWDELADIWQPGAGVWS